MARMRDLEAENVRLNKDICRRAAQSRNHSGGHGKSGEAFFAKENGV